MISTRKQLLVAILVPFLFSCQAMRNGSDDNTDSADSICDRIGVYLQFRYQEDGHLPAGFSEIKRGFLEWTSIGLTTATPDTEYSWVVGNPVEDRDSPCPYLPIEVFARRSGKVIGYAIRYIDLEGPSRAWVKQLVLLPNGKTDLLATPKNVANKIAEIRLCKQRISLDISTYLNAPKSLNGKSVIAIAKQFKFGKHVVDGREWLAVGYPPAKRTFLYSPDGPDSSTRPVEVDYKPADFPGM